LRKRKEFDSREGKDVRQPANLMLARASRNKASNQKGTNNTVKGNKEEQIVQNHQSVKYILPT
jgi:hypothetical protein